MDFGINGIFKQLLFAEKAAILDGLKKVATKVWNKLPLGMIIRTMENWSTRAKLVIEKMLFNLKIAYEVSDEYLL